MNGGKLGQPKDDGPVSTPRNRYYAALSRCERRSNHQRAARGNSGKRLWSLSEAAHDFASAAMHLVPDPRQAVW
ncbi:hypothetical protein ACWDSJ_16730 [Nocardia sp. NPDC003482]